MKELKNKIFNATCLAQTIFFYYYLFWAGFLIFMSLWMVTLTTLYPTTITTFVEQTDKVKWTMVMAFPIFGIVCSWFVVFYPHLEKYSMQPIEDIKKKFLKLVGD